MTSALKVLQLLRMALLGSAGIYVILGELLAHHPSAPPNALLFFVLTFVGASEVVMILGVRKLLVVPAAARLAAQPNDTLALTRWRGGYILIFALSESIALFGLVLRFLGFTRAQVAPFYLAGIVLLVYFAPREAGNAIG